MTKKHAAEFVILDVVFANCEPAPRRLMIHLSSIRSVEFYPDEDAARQQTTNLSWLGFGRPASDYCFGVHCSNMAEFFITAEQHAKLIHALIDRGDAINLTNYDSIETLQREADGSTRHSLAALPIFPQDKWKEMIEKEEQHKTDEPYIVHPGTPEQEALVIELLEKERAKKAEDGANG